MLTLPGGFTLTDLLWEVLFLVPFIMLLWQKEKLVRLFQIGVAAYLIGDAIYQLVRLDVFPHSPDRWMILGPRILAVAFLLKLAEERLIPHERERVTEHFRHSRTAAVQVIFLVSALAGIFLLTASVIWNW